MVQVMWNIAAIAPLLTVTGLNLRRSQMFPASGGGTFGDFGGIDSEGEADTLEGDALFAEASYPVVPTTPSPQTSPEAGKSKLPRKSSPVFSGEGATSSDRSGSIGIDSDAEGMSFTNVHGVLAEELRTHSDGADSQLTTPSSSEDQERSQEHSGENVNDPLFAFDDTDESWGAPRERTRSGSSRGGLRESLDSPGALTAAAMGESVEENF